mgnify:CR=1 FL=1
MRQRLWFIIPAVLLIILLFPLAASAAITDSQVIAIFNAGIQGVVNLAKVAYCASGVTALC